MCMAVIADAAGEHCENCAAAYRSHILLETYSYNNSNKVK